MYSDPTVIVEGISKRYQLYEEPIHRLYQFLFRGRKNFYREFWALHPISFSVNRGESVGFVGRNGSGKSTLLQIIAGTLNPSTGAYTVRGRVAALLELGAGFNPEFTGRENVYLNGALFGLNRAEVDRRMGDIERFAEIGEFIDQPVKTYSSGMYVRLAFSSAIHVDPDVLIVDEALAVGDAAFQYKCMGKIRELQARGMSIIFVTHDTLAVKQFCSRAGWLHEGRLVALGEAVDIAGQYEDFLRQQMPANGAAAPILASAPEQTVSNGVGETFGQLISTELVDAHGAQANTILTGSQVRLKITYEIFKSAPEGFVVGAAIFRSDDTYVCGLNTKIDKIKIPNDRGRHTITLSYDNFSLLPGTYYIKTGLFDDTAMVRFDFSHRACEFTMTSPHKGEGVVVLDHTWSVNL